MANPPTSLADRTSLATDLNSLFAETVSLVHRLKVVVEDIHQRGELSAGRRGILVGLDKLGPQTVPQMARARPVSRQHIQSLVNPLVEEGFVELVENPAHRRSRLVQLTAKGREFVREMGERETIVLNAMNFELDESDLEIAASVLRGIRKRFESPEWQVALHRERTVLA